MTESLNSIPAGLAKRLAEAADSFRDNMYHYFVCKTQFPYDLHNTAGYAYSEEASSAADSLLQDLGSGYYKFGPYKTADPDETTIEYDSVKITFLLNGNELSEKTQILSNGADAVILSLSAYDKFFQPYYVRLYGIEVAEEFRNAAKTALSSQYLLTHLGLSSKSSTGGTRYVAASYNI
jgi:hypothetical protein